MSRRIIAEFKVKPDKIDSFKEFMASALVDTRGFSGLIKLEILEDRSESILLAIPEWESHEAYDVCVAWRLGMFCIALNYRNHDVYVAWRLENGAADLLEEYLVGGIETGFKPR
tara:strand:- start:314 stop:655 length:342 start_codon:yes stop_codon:yes gene_type:complete